MLLAKSFDFAENQNYKFSPNPEGSNVESTERLEMCPEELKHLRGRVSIDVKAIGADPAKLKVQL